LERAVKTIAYYIWAIFVSIVRAISYLLQISIGLILILAAIAEVASFGLNYGNIVVDSIINIAGRIGLPEIISQSPEINPPTKKCVRYETRVTDLRCQDETNPRKRFLCQVTVPPAEIVCVE